MSWKALLQWRKVFAKCKATLHSAQSFIAFCKVFFANCETTNQAVICKIVKRAAVPAGSRSSRAIVWRFPK